MTPADVGAADPALLAALRAGDAPAIREGLTSALSLMLQATVDDARRAPGS